MWPKEIIKLFNVRKADICDCGKRLIGKHICLEQDDPVYFLTGDCGGMCSKHGFNRVMNYSKWNGIERRKKIFVKKLDEEIPLKDYLSVSHRQE